jgi:hypothetical protein
MPPMFGRDEIPLPAPSVILLQVQDPRQCLLRFHLHSLRFYGAHILGDIEGRIL